MAIFRPLLRFIDGWNTIGMGVHYGCLKNPLEKPVEQVCGAELHAQQTNQM